MIELLVETQEFILDVEPAVTVNSGGDPYLGVYEVTPKLDQETVLKTAKKVLSKDVTVKKIPQYEVSNEAGGTTFIIGEEHYG